MPKKYNIVVPYLRDGEKRQERKNKATKKKCPELTEEKQGTEPEEYISSAFQRKDQASKQQTWTES